MVLSSISAFGASKSLTEKKKEIESKIADTNKQFDGAKDKKLYYDAQVDGLQNDIADLDDIIDTIDSDIVKNNKTIDETTGQLNLKQDNFEKRLRALQHRGSMNYLDVVFGAESFSDFLVRLTLVSNIINHDRDMITEIGNIKKQLTEAKTMLEIKKQEQTDAKALILSRQNEMENMAAKQKATMDNIVADKEQYKKELAAAEVQIREEDEKIRAATKKAEEETKKKQANKKDANSPAAKKSSGNMIWPIPAGGIITSRFGYRTDPTPSTHTGVDIAISSGNAIVAAKDGVVASISNDSYGYGKYVVISHGNGESTLYAHTSKIYVAVGQDVSQGEKIAAVGSTGFSTGPHLHFEVRLNGTRVNPEPYIK